ncbi:MAG: hypothetical protein ACREPM_19485 [Gemmatimonadaceae bacterium]
MPAARASGIALHVEAAKRLLRELEQHGETALHALGRESGAEFFAAVDERDRILGELGGVVEALTSERETPGAVDPKGAATSALFAEIAQAAAAALESSDRLASQTRRERDRLAVALRRTARPDSVAHHYAASSPRTRTISVTG